MDISRNEGLLGSYGFLTVAKVHVAGTVMYCQRQHQGPRVKDPSMDLTIIPNPLWIVKHHPPIINTSPYNWHEKNERHCVYWNEHGKQFEGFGGLRFRHWVKKTPRFCAPSARVEQAPRKWEERAAPPLLRKKAGEEGVVLRPRALPVWKCHVIRNDTI